MEDEARLVIAIGLAVVASGCLGVADEDRPADPMSPAGAANATETGNTSTDVERLWDEAERLTIVNSTWTDPTGLEADVLCASGGAPKISRTEERVLPGTGHLAVQVDARNVNSGIQAGYVLDEDAAEHAPDQQGITWLDSVPPGSAATIEIDVGPDESEPPGEARPWAFYLRMNPGVDELCYTGVNVGERSFVVEAVRQG